jgi:c-di-GMP-binding flagellar brake protein YcgR
MVELRRYERVGFLGKLELTATTSGLSQPARSLDLSLGGVGAITQSVFAVGEIVTVIFFLKDTANCEVKDHVAGRVVHLAANVDANTIGIQFLNPLSEAEHPLLVGKLMRL